MPLVDAKCTNCGATLKVDNTNEAAICEHCGSAFIIEKAINNYNVTNNINAEVVNIFNPSSNNTNPDFLIESGKLLRYRGKAQEVVIPDDVYVIGNNAFKNTEIQKVVFHKGVVRIETSTGEESSQYKGAFSGCDNLKEVHLAGIKEIPESTFEKCSNLTTVIIMNGIEIIGRNAFFSCHNLTFVSLPKTLKRIETWAFGWCYSLKEITIPANVQYVACQSFETCKSLEKVTIENGVRTIHGGAFLGCDSISVLRLPQSVNIDNISQLRCMKFNIVADNPELSNRINEMHTKKGGCYVATAVYGSYDCPQVWTLRRYRDDTLAKTWYGRAFICLYYAISPSLVKWFGSTDWFRNMWKPKLDRMVSNLNSDGVEDTPYEDKKW